MAFWSKVGHALGAPLRAPGMGAITKPINAGLQATPGLRGVPASLGQGGSPQGPPPSNPGIGPSPQMMQGPPPDMAPPPNPQGDMSAAMNGMGGGPPPGTMPPQSPQLQPMGQMPQMDPQQLQNMRMQMAGGPQMPQRGMPPPGLGPSPQMMNQMGQGQGQMGGITRRIPPRGMPQ